MRVRQDGFAGGSLPERWRQRVGCVVRIARPRWSRGECRGCFGRSRGRCRQGPVGLRRTPSPAPRAAEELESPVRAEVVMVTTQAGQVLQ